jgi:hypothetical protein
MTAVELAERFCDFIEDVDAFKDEHQDDRDEPARGAVECESMARVVAAHVEELEQAAIRD